MYLDHFQLSELPFRLSPDPSFMYLSQIHSRAKAYMESNRQCGKIVLAMPDHP